MLIAGRMWQAVVTAMLLLALSGCREPTQNRQGLTYTYEQIFRSGGWATREFSYWRQDIDLETSMPDYSHLGAYPIGNGRVFALTGLRVPLGVIEDVLGPTYQKTYGLLGSYALTLIVDGEPVLLPQQSTAWVAPGGVVHTRWESREGLRVDILDTVPVEVNAILRLVVVSNRGKEDIGDLALAQTPSLPAAQAPGGDLLVTRGTTRVRCGFASADTEVIRGNVLPELPQKLPKRLLPLGAVSGDLSEIEAVRCRLGRLPSGESVGKVAYLLVSGDEAAEQAHLAAIERQGAALVEAGHQYWHKRAQETVQVSGVPQEIAEFLTISKYLCQVQQAKAGGFSPMHKYSYRWIRDSNGPIKYLLDAGDFEAVGRDLEYHFSQCAQKQEIFNNVELNLEPKWVPEFDWSEAPAPKAEIASFVILQDYWYFKHTGETEQLAERWGYLRRCLDGHETDEEGTLPFHGDETYRFPGYELFGHEDVSDYVHMRLRSADSAFEYVAAAEAMAEMAEALDKGEEARECREAARRIRRATERHYWQRDRGYYAPARSDISDELYRCPFANISLRPLWIGYAEPSEQRQVDNVLNALAYLYKPKAGTARTTPACAYYVTMTPGYLLSNLAALDHPAAADALEGLLAAAEPSGGFAEMNGPDDLPSDDAWGLHRVRPWEGGINASAVLQYLTGFEPDAPNRQVRFAPHLPRGCANMKVTNLRVAEARLELEVSARDKGLLYTIKCEQAESPLTVELMASARGDDLRATEANYRELGGYTRRTRARFGRAHLTVTGVKLEAGALVAAGTDRLRAAGDRLEVMVERSGYPKLAQIATAEEPFDYGEAKIPSGGTLLLTWSKTVLEGCQEQVEGRLQVMDTRIAWPAEYLRSALLIPPRRDRPRFDTVITDLKGFPGAFKRPEFWTEGPGAAVLKEFEAAGGQVEEARGKGAGKAPAKDLIN